MSMLIANAMAERASGRSGQLSITVLDECWALLDSPVLAPEVVQLFRTARKRNASVWAISQTMEDFVGTERQPRLQGPGVVKNSTTKIIGQQRDDLTALTNHLYLNDVVLKEIKGLAAPRKGRSAEAVLALGERAETTEVIRLVPTPVDYWICTKFQRERMYRKYIFSITSQKRHCWSTIATSQGCFRDAWRTFQNYKRKVPAPSSSLGKIERGQRNEPNSFDVFRLWASLQLAPPCRSIAGCCTPHRRALSHACIRPVWVAWRHSEHREHHQRRDPIYVESARHDFAISAGFIPANRLAGSIDRPGANRDYGSSQSVPRHDAVDLQRWALTAPHCQRQSRWNRLFEIAERTISQP